MGQRGSVAALTLKDIPVDHGVALLPLVFRMFLMSAEISAHTLSPMQYMTRYEVP